MHQLAVWEPPQGEIHNDLLQIEFTSSHTSCFVSLQVQVRKDNLKDRSKVGSQAFSPHWVKDSSEAKAFTQKKTYGPFPQICGQSSFLPCSLRQCQGQLLGDSLPHFTDHVHLQGLQQAHQLIISHIKTNIVTPIILSILGQSFHMMHAGLCGGCF